MKLLPSPLAILALPALSLLHAAESPLLTVSDFEKGGLTPLNLQQGRDEALALVTSPVRAGKYAAKTWLRASDPEANGGQRAEFSDGKKITKIEMEKDYWYGLSIYVPEDFVAPTKTNAVLFQWHTQQGGPSPVLSIRVKGDEWLVWGNASPTEKRRSLAKLPLVKGKWVDWVVHVKWSAKPEGFWTLWKDGVEVVNERNIVTQYPEELGPYAKFGQYHSVDETEQNTVFFDEYRVAGPGGSYELVAPPNIPARQIQKP